MQWGVYLARSREINFLYLDMDLETLARYEKTLNDSITWEVAQQSAVKELMNYV